MHVFFPGQDNYTSLENRHIEEELGLQSGHAYSAIKFIEIMWRNKPVQLVQIRNPWGNLFTINDHILEMTT